MKEGIDILKENETLQLTELPPKKNCNTRTVDICYENRRKPK